jgi:hypothetical protein
MKRILALLLTSVWGQTFTSFVTPSVGPSKGPVADVPGGFRCMNRGSSPAYSWTNHDVRWVGGVLTVSLDDGNTGNPAFRDWWCVALDPLQRAERPPPLSHSDPPNPHNLTPPTSKPQLEHGPHQ